MTKEETDLIIAEQNKSRNEILKAVAKFKSDYHELCSLKDMRIEQLEKDVKLLGEQCNQLLADKGKLTDKCKELKAQIEKMQCCGNCRYTHCTWSTQTIDTDGNRWFHNWNEEKEDYCDTGKGKFAKYQLWELADD